MTLATPPLASFLIHYVVLATLTRVKSYQNLKQNSWMAKGLGRRHLGHQNCIETLQSDRESLIQELSLLIIIIIIIIL